MRYPPDHPFPLTTKEWDITFSWKVKRLRFLEDKWIDELLDTDFERERKMDYPFEDERKVLLFIKPVADRAINMTVSLARVVDIKL